MAPATVVLGLPEHDGASAKVHVLTIDSQGLGGERFLSQPGRLYTFDGVAASLALGSQPAEERLEHSVGLVCAVGVADLAIEHERLNVQVQGRILSRERAEALALNVR